MKLAFAIPDWPGAGALALDVQRLTRALAGAGHEVLVLAGSPERAAALALLAGEVHEGLLVQRLVRSDPFHAHWQKSAHPAVARLVRGWLRERAPDVLHVFGWRHLTRDLVHLAARERIPAVLSLTDASASCLLGTRVLPSGGACEVSAAAQPCLRCAGSVAPRTPWIPPDAQFLARYVYHQDLARELALARAVLVHTAEAQEHARRFLAAELPQGPRFIGLDRACEPSLASEYGSVYEAARAAGAPVLDARENPYAALLLEGTLREWDARATRATPAELGFEGPAG